jgi:hypothetical protein
MALVDKIGRKPLMLLGAGSYNIVFIDFIFIGYQIRICFMVSVNRNWYLALTLAR